MYFDILGHFAQKLAEIFINFLVTLKETIKWSTSRLWPSVNLLLVGNFKNFKPIINFAL